MKKIFLFTFIIIIALFWHGKWASSSLVFAAYPTSDCVMSGAGSAFISNVACGFPITVTHTAGDVAPVTKTVTYGTVISSLTGSPKCWITQNLGATTNAATVTESTEPNAGWYWQFNRKQGFKHDGTTRTPFTTWTTSISEDKNWETANDPCTLLLGAGWRLPTSAEWTSADTNWATSTDTYASVFKLHMAGYLGDTNGALASRGGDGRYWSNTQINSTNGYLLNNAASNSYLANTSKALGYTARCVKDISVAGCRFSARIDGLDGGTGINNTAKLTVPANKSLTIIDEGSNPSTLAVGTMVIENGGSVIIPDGSKIMIGAALYLKDEDNDGYPASGEQFAGYAAPSAEWKRKNLFDPAKLLTVDCVDTDEDIPATNPCPGNVDFNTGDFERSKKIGSDLQGYYGEIGKDPSLVGLWHLNETADNSCSGGQDACDSSGNGNQGTATGTTIVDGLMGKARSFSGSGQYVSVSDNDTLDISSNFTLETWVYPRSFSVQQNLVCKGDGNVAYNYCLYLTASNGYILLGGGSYPNSSIAPPLNQWSHIAVSFNGTSFYFYLNGQLIYSIAGSLGAVNSYPLYIGYNNYSTQYFNGILDEIQISKRALSPEEIKAQATRSPWARYTSSVIDMGSAKTSVPLTWTGLGIGTRTWSSGTLDTSNEGEVPKDATDLVAAWYFNETSGETATNEGATLAATGGTITDSGGYRIHTFTGSGTFTPSFSDFVEVLVVGGGGGGEISGGGGGGGIVYNASYPVTSGQAIPVTVGTGGLVGTNGNNSVFKSITAIGGGKGGILEANGGSGGSGGGGGGRSFASGGSETAGQGYAGGNGYDSEGYGGGGGGGGAGGAGASSGSRSGGAGGNGTAYSMIGSSVYYGGGGGGGSDTGGTAVNGGLGGGGNGGLYKTSHATAGTPNTGGGGGGAGNGDDKSLPAVGGSGVVIIRYPTSSSSNNGTLTNFGTCLDTQDDTTAGCQTSGWTLANKRWGAGALMFDGTDDYVSIPDIDALSFGNGTTDTSFSIETWVNPTTLAGTGAGNWIVNKRGGSTKEEYQIDFWEGKFGMALFSQGSNTNYFSVTTNSSFIAGQWYHLVATYDGSRSPSGIKIYANGVLQGTTSSITGSYVAMSNTTQDVVIGKAGWSSGQYFKGIIDSTRIYSRALTPSEILSNYEAGNIEFQWRAGSTTTPDSTDYSAGTNWSKWEPSGSTGATGGYESQIDSMDTADKTWNIDNALSDSSLTKKPTTAVSTGTGTDGACSVTGITNINTQSCAGKATADGVSFSLSAPLSGGSISFAGGYTIHTFTESGTLKVPIGEGRNVDVLVVGGGGGGGMDMGGGGGGGGVLYSESVAVASDQSINVVVGAGGAGAPAAGTNGQPSAHQYIIGASPGQNSIFNEPTEITGGTITESGGYRIHTFTEPSGTLTVPSVAEGRSIEVLVVGGGGGGGVNAGAGGGGGSVIVANQTVTTGTYNITVGSGGTRGVSSTNYAGGGGGIGGTSTFGTITATGGGGGGAYSSMAGTAGANGGGGGDPIGAGGVGVAPTLPEGVTGTVYAGYTGGAGQNATHLAGGGAGASGNATLGAGGPGVLSTIDGYYYGGGGGGGTWAQIGKNGGIGGGGGGGSNGYGGGTGGGSARIAGGAGSNAQNVVNTGNGGANTGGGGGGGTFYGSSGSQGGLGGSGIVVVRYLYTRPVSSIRAFGGGKGGSSHMSYTPGYAGGDGGSGGGAGGYSNTSLGSGAGTAGQGYRGGNNGGYYYSGGGGGAGGAGADGNNKANGGVGFQSAINGTSLYWGGGGGGSGYSIDGGNGGAGGGGGGSVGATTGGAGLNNGSAGGGGAVNAYANSAGGDGGASTGGGGGGGGHYNATNKGGNGGSGVVIVRYPSITSSIANAGDTSITLPVVPTGLAVGDEFLIINQQGSTTDNKSVGLYETHVISSISSKTIYFTDYTLKNTYDGTTQKISVQRIPNYTNVTVGRTASGKSGADANNAGYSCLDLLNSGANVNGEVLYSATNLVSQWNFNNTSGTSATNDAGSCGASCDGTLTSFTNTTGQDVLAGSGWTAANKKWGAGALMFNGSSNYVSVPDSDSWAFGTGDFTIETWIKYSTVNGNTIISQGADGNNRWMLKYDGSANLQFDVYSASSQIINISRAWVPTANTWYYLTVIRTGNTFRLFVNGSQIGTDETDTDAIPNYAGILKIGLNPDNSLFFNGTIDSTRIYSRALTADEIDRNYIDSRYWIDPDGAGGNAPVQAQCNMTRDGGGWTMAVKNWYLSETALHAEALGSIADATTLKGNRYKLADTTVRDIIGPSQNLDVMADQAGYNSAYSTGNYEYVVLRNYTGYWRFDMGMATSLTDTLFQSYRLSDNALASTFNLQCGQTSQKAGINCYPVLSNNPQGGAGCNINMGSSTAADWHYFYMSVSNDDTYLYVCNGAQHSSSYAMNPRFWVREKQPAVLTASPWDGTKGGIVAFRANGTVTVNNGAISTAGIGYRGGSGSGALYNTVRAYKGESFAGPSVREATYASADGGGGGGMISTGGPGGSYGSLGTNGVASNAGYEAYKGLVGITSGQTSLTDRMLFGSGGGGGGDGYNGAVAWGQTNTINGAGGNGGGITFIGANTLTVSSTGKIDSNGYSGSAGWNNTALASWISGGSGGGGAGGSIALVGNTLTLNNKLVSASGGKSVSPYAGNYSGWTVPPFGGSGGAGRIAISYNTSVSGVSEPGATQNKVQTANKLEGTGALQLTTDSLQSDGTVGLWHFGQNSPTKTFGYTGADQTYTVPAGVTSLTVKMWGGGGGGGAPGGWTYGYPGGGGGYTTGTLAVTPGQTLTVMVGAGGNKGSSSVKTPAYGGGGQNCAAAGTDCQYAGQGGGRSAVRISNVDIITAGGGGGGGSMSGSVSDMSGGGGGGNTGQAGWATNASTALGGGGTQSAGGAGATATSYTGSPGTQYLGGSPNSNSYGGGGGGGWYGGGGGGYATALASMGGGGGGSGYIAGTGVSSATTTGASARLQGNMSDADNAGAGAGGLPNTNGASGKVVIIPNVANTDLPYQEYDASGYNNHGTLTGTTLVDGIFGKARSFNGTSDYISVPNSTDLDFSNNNFTVDWWEYRTSSTDGRSSMHRGASGGQVAPFLLGYTSANILYVYMSSNGSSWDIASAKSLGAITLNQWVHLAVVRNGTTFTTYKNGVQQDTWTSSLALQTRSEPMEIGRYYTAGATYFMGSIDEVRISNVVRSADQIAEAYRLGRDKRATKTISSTENLTNPSKLLFQFAGDRLGTYGQMTVGNSAFANYEPDANTVGLWHLEEATGNGAYLKDSAGSNHGTPVGTTFTQGKIGKGRLINLAAATQTEYINTGITNTASANFSNAFSASAWIYPTAYDASHNTVIGQETGFLFAFNSAGASSNYIYAGGGWTSFGCGTIPLNQWTYYGLTYDGAYIKSYINGQLCNSIAKTGNMDSTSLIYIGVRTAAPYQPFHGIIDEPRIDKIARTAPQIREAYEIGKRSHPITVDFKSGLVAGALIADVNDTAFSVDETAYGSSAKANHLFVGDKIIVKENVGGTEYITQGTVATVNSSTGAVTVSAWDSGSTFPSGGFTVNATVFKWQREIMDLTGSLPSQRSAITYLTFRPTDMSSGATMWIDDIRSGGPYLNTSPQTLTPSSASRYFQLRALFSTTDTATSSSLTSLRIQDIPTPLTPTPTPGCQIGCNKCVGGSAVPVTAGEDDNVFCLPITCSGKTWGWGESAPLSCMEAAVKTANNGMCNGAGACYTALRDVCQEKPTPALASCGSAGCKKACGVADTFTSSTSYDTVGEICYTDFSTQTCPDGKRCNATGTCITCEENGTACTAGSECCTGTCTTFYTDSDGDGYGTGAAVKKCGTTASGYATNNTDCNDTGTNSANVRISATCYVDVDNDNYGSTTAKSCTNNATCGSATWASGAAGTPAASGNFSAVNTDCYDANPATTNAELAYPGSATCGTTNRGDGSFDYNCAGGNTYCGTAYYAFYGPTLCLCAADRCGACEYWYTSYGQVGCGAGGSQLITVNRLQYGGYPASCYVMYCGPGPGAYSAQACQ
jgi:hypothetical protein